eukprot:6394764-Prymnesium_polylepis.2
MLEPIRQSTRPVDRQERERRHDERVGVASCTRTRSSSLDAATRNFFCEAGVSTKQCARPAAGLAIVDTVQCWSGITPRWGRPSAALTVLVATVHGRQKTGVVRAVVWHGDGALRRRSRDGQGVVRAVARRRRVRRRSRDRSGMRALSPRRKWWMPRSSRGVARRA